MEFPFLEDSTSEGYAQARAKAEEAWIGLKIRTSFHGMADMIQEWFSKAGLEMEQVSYAELLEAFAVIDRRVPQST